MQLIFISWFIFRLSLYDKTGAKIIYDLYMFIAWYGTVKCRNS